MPEVNQNKNGVKLSRRNILKAGTAAGLAVIAGAATPKLSRNGVANAAGNLLVLDVQADPSLLDLVPTTNGGPFYIPGEIFAHDTKDKVGDFHCWGFF